MSDTKLITPVSECRYLHIFKPNTKFSPDGEYSVTCVVDESNQEWKTLIAGIQSELDAYYDAQIKVSKKNKLKKCPHLPWKDSTEGGQVFVVKNKAIGRRKDGSTWETKPQIIGPDKQPITEKDLEGSLGSGTKAVVGFTVNLWTNDAQGVGVSARLNLVQLIEPKYYKAFDGFTDASGCGLKTYESSFRRKQSVDQEADNLKAMFDSASLPF